MCRLLFLAMLSLVIASLSGCGGKTESKSSGGPAASSSPDMQFDTPEAAYAAAAEANKKNDMRSFATMLTAQSQAMMAGSMVLAGGFVTAGDEDKEREFEELLAKHGISLDDEEPKSPIDMENATPEAMMMEMVKPVKDVPAFIGEVTAWMAKNSDGQGGMVEFGKLGEVTIDGDTASSISHTDRGPIPIEFRKVNGSWLMHMPEDKEVEEEPDDGTPGLGVMSYGEKAIKLRHALAYKSKHFDDPCTVVLLTAKPIYERDMNTLKEMLKSEGNDDAFFVRGPNIKLSLDADGKLLFMFAWVDNMSINRNDGVELDVTMEGGRVRGTAATSEPQEVADTTFEFQAEFDVELLQP